MLATNLAPVSDFDLNAFLHNSVRLPMVVEQAPLQEWHDEGLAHYHHWATESALATKAIAPRSAQPLVADTASVRTPSCVVHDDIHYGQG